MRCSHCKRTDVPLLKYAKNKYGTQYYMCHDCHAARQRKYRKTPTGRASATRAVNKYNARNPERRKAWHLAKQLPLQPCEVCGNPKTDRHHDDPKKPLDVKFLCRRHHRARHRELKQMGFKLKKLIGLTA